MSETNTSPTFCTKCGGHLVRDSTGVLFEAKHDTELGRLPTQLGHLNIYICVRCGKLEFYMEAYMPGGEDEVVEETVEGD